VVFSCLLSEFFLYMMHRFWQERLVPLFQGVPNPTRIVLQGAMAWHIGLAALAVLYIVVLRSFPQRTWTAVAGAIVVALMLIFLVVVGIAVIVVIPFMPVSAL
jgi:hypothetical protein